MSCPKCNTAVPEGSAFCNACGAAINVSPAAPLHAAAAAGAAGANEPEEELWKGRFSAKARAHHLVFWVLWASVLAYVWMGVLSPEMKEKSYAFWLFAGASGLPLLYILFGISVQKLGTRYRLTTHRLFRERGIVSRQMDEIELIRVDDVSVRQNILQRIFNVGVVTVIAPTDATEPRLELVGIPNPIEVKEKIRTYVRKRRDRSLHVESL